jgi:adenylate cyclase class 2
MKEIEVKIKVGDPVDARRRLLALGAVVERERTLEENTLYDFPSGLLASKRQALRLRTVGRTTFLTFKGAPQKSRSFKVREEYETDVRSAKQAREILRGLGLKAAFAYRKHRTRLRKGRLKVCLDETPVGNYLELEGERHEITRFARALGFRRADFITLDYVQMIKAAAGTAPPEGG